MSIKAGGAINTRRQDERATVLDFGFDEETSRPPRREGEDGRRPRVSGIRHEEGASGAPAIRKGRGKKTERMGEKTERKEKGGEKTRKTVRQSSRVILRQCTGEPLKLSGL